MSLQEFVDSDQARPLNLLSKGALPFAGVRPDRVADLALRVRDLPTPALTLDIGAIDHNIATLARWCVEQGVELAPHGKTTMSPALWLRQLDSGAWGITVANEHQLAVALEAGVRRIQVATPLGRPGAVQRIRDAVAAGALEEALVWVDSVEAVAVAAGEGPEVGALVDIGALGARTGTRTLHDALAVAAAVSAAPGLALRGVAGYEGAVADVGLDRPRFESYIAALVAACRAVASQPGSVRPILSVGGSAGIAETLRLVRRDLDQDDVRIILRSGASIAHDDGYYERKQEPALPLRAALSVWGRVVSAPEPGLALVDVGRRDVSDDQGFPLVLGVHRGGEPIAAEATVTALDDQHAYLRIAAGGPSPAVGDLVEFGVSHPCTTFDRWPVMAVVQGRGDSSAAVVGAMRTCF
jgi:D-serine deaminase-like pyridoxal phosphate-dependent protein